jgi:hypothetical protein
MSNKYLTFFEKKYGNAAKQSQTFHALQKIFTILTTQLGGKTSFNIVLADCLHRALDKNETVYLPHIFDEFFMVGGYGGRLILSDADGGALNKLAEKLSDKVTIIEGEVVPNLHSIGQALDEEIDLVYLGPSMVDMSKAKSPMNNMKESLAIFNLTHGKTLVVCEEEEDGAGRHEMLEEFLSESGNDEKKPCITTEKIKGWMF